MVSSATGGVAFMRPEDVGWPAAKIEAGELDGSKGYAPQPGELIPALSVPTGIIQVNKVLCSRCKAEIELGKL